MPGTVEHLMITAGTALAGPVDEPLELTVGDFLTYRGDIPHTFAATQPGTTAILISELR